MTGYADRNDFFTEFIHIEVKLFQEKMLSPNLLLRAKLAAVVGSTPTRSISSNLVRYGIRMSVFLGICRTNCPTDNHRCGRNRRRRTTARHSLQGV
jgi:hypothetical protein